MDVHIQSYNALQDVSVVYLRIFPVKGLSPRGQNLKKGGAWGALGPKSQKRAKAPGMKIKKMLFLF